MRNEDHFAQSMYDSDKLGKELLKINAIKVGSKKQPKICHIMLTCRTQ